MGYKVACDVVGCSRSAPLERAPGEYDGVLLIGGRHITWTEPASVQENPLPSGGEIQEDEHVILPAMMAGYLKVVGKMMATDNALRGARFPAPSRRRTAMICPDHVLPKVVETTDDADELAVMA